MLLSTNALFPPHGPCHAKKAPYSRKIFMLTAPVAAVAEMSPFIVLHKPNINLFLVELQDGVHVLSFFGGV